MSRMLDWFVKALAVALHFWAQDGVQSPLFTTQQDDGLDFQQSASGCDAFLLSSFGLSTPPMMLGHDLDCGWLAISEARPFQIARACSNRADSTWTKTRK